MSRRDQIKLSPEEILAFLRSSKTITIVSNGKDGHPHPMPMWFVVDDDLTVRMTTFRRSQKVRNVQRDPRVSLMVESGKEYQELKGVVIYGNAEIIEDMDVIRDTLMRGSANDCLTAELLEEGWVLTCQSRCVSPIIKIEYPD